MPDHIDHALPLRIERSPAELRIEAETVVAQLAKDLQVDDPGDGVGYGAALADRAARLVHLRASAVSEGLQWALDLLQTADAKHVNGGADAHPLALEAVGAPEKARAWQEAVILGREQAAADAQLALTAAERLLSGRSRG